MVNGYLLTVIAISPYTWPCRFALRLYYVGPLLKSLLALSRRSDHRQSLREAKVS